MRIGLLLLGLGWVTSACGGNAAVDSKQVSAGNAQGVSTAGATGDAAECRLPSRSADAGLGACTVARALVVCTSSAPGSGSCECLSDDPTTCAFCREQLTGDVTCLSQCAANEYAVACGGPPIPDGDVHYEDAPSGCTGLGYSPAGSEFVCCPCL